MEVKHIIFVILGLVVQVKCDNSDNGTTLSDENYTELVTESLNNNTETEEPEIETNIGIRGLYGGWYYNSKARNPDNGHYIHGNYQTPIKDYYTKQHYYRDDDNDQVLDYYLRFGLNKMTDDNFQYDDFHHFYHDINRTISQQDSILSEFIILCHSNATFLCPENTETICLMNGTIYCMSLITTVGPCLQNETTYCVNSVVPCVKSCTSVDNYFEDVTLPCLSVVTIVDVYEDKIKKKTLNRVGGTFIEVDALEEKERTFCVTVITDPKPRETED